MTEKDFHHLNKMELLEIMQMLEENVVQLQTENATLKAEQKELYSQREEWQSSREEFQAEREKCQAERLEFSQHVFNCISANEERIELSQKKIAEAREKASSIIHEAEQKRVDVMMVATQAAKTIQELTQVYFYLLGILK
jgi:hypothetical protein